jgi:hypothetical protein
MLDHNMKQLNLLQDALSCAAATLFAIEAGDLFKALPADPADRDQHNNGCVMLATLGDHLRGIQAQVDALDPVASTKAEG